MEEAGREAPSSTVSSSSSSRPDTPLVGQVETAPVRLLQDSNKGSASPLTNELLIAARKGYSKELERILKDNSSTAKTTIDRVSIGYMCMYDKEYKIILWPRFIILSSDCLCCFYDLVHW